LITGHFLRKCPVFNTYRLSSRNLYRVYEKELCSRRL